MNMYEYSNHNHQQQQQLQQYLMLLFAQKYPTAKKDICVSKVAWLCEKALRSQSNPQLAPLPLHTKKLHENYLLFIWAPEIAQGDSFCRGFLATQYNIAGYSNILHEI